MTAPEGFTTGRPTVGGWYDVIFEPGDAPTRVYLRVSGDYLTWGWDEEDDPELIDSPSVCYRPAAGPETGRLLCH